METGKVTVMSKSNALHIRLLSPRVWRSLVKEATAGLRSSREILLTEAIITSLHNRHVGISPQLAAFLAPLLLLPDAQAKTPWIEVQNRLKRELLPNKDEIHSSYRTGFLFSAAPAYVLFRLVLPLIEAACHELGDCYLFCEDEVTDPYRSQDYKKYTEALLDQIVYLATSENARLELFWKDRATTLASLSYPEIQLESSEFGLPENSLAGVGFLFRLEKLPVLRRDFQNMQRLVSPIQRMKSLARREGGVRGVRVTRRIEELDSILFSEFLNPRLLLVDRLLNSGYLAIEREPRREKLRDALIVGVMPPSTKTGLGAEFLKACWFNTMAVLGQILRRHNLHQSEFHWIEGDAFERVRICTFPLEILSDLPVYHLALERELNRIYRQEFLTRLRWLPAFLDARASYESLIELEKGQKSGDRFDHVQQWLAAAWRHGMKNLPWVEEFAFVHIMVFLPAEWRGEAPPRFVGQVSGQLRLGHYPGRYTSLTYVPAKLETPTGNPEELEKHGAIWAFESQNQPCKPLFLQTQPSDLAQIAERLEQQWLEQIMQEIQRV